MPKIPDPFISDMSSYNNLEPISMISAHSNVYHNFRQILAVWYVTLEDCFDMSHNHVVAQAKMSHQDITTPNLKPNCLYTLYVSLLFNTGIGHSPLTNIIDQKHRRESLLNTDFLICSLRITGAFQWVSVIVERPLSKKCIIKGLMAKVKGP